MQKIISYLYPNRIEILADLNGFNVEYTKVYQRTIKIYNGIDNTIEFDIKNADQKRIDLTTVTVIQLNVMDASGNALATSPYTITPTLLKGIGTAVIPQSDLLNLDPQFLKYSVSALKNSAPVLMYCDSRFSAVGTIELVGNAMPVVSAPRTFDNFTAEIDLQGVPIWHSSAIPAKFYEAAKTNNLQFDISVTGFVGSIWLEATTASTISVNSFLKEGKPFGSWSQVFPAGMYNGIVPYGTSIPIGDYNYFRLSFQTPAINGIGGSFTVTRSNNEYHVMIKYGGTGYTAGSMIIVPGYQLGGITGINDLIITVNGVYGSSSTMASSYTISEINEVTWTGVAAAGDGFYIVSGTNYSGVVDKVVVSKA